jgi:hypothetical protein
VPTVSNAENTEDEKQSRKDDRALNPGISGGKLADFSEKST